jgi:hypothetical protein
MADKKLRRIKNGAPTISIMTFSIMTLSIMTFSIITLCIMTLSKVTLCIMAFRKILNKMQHSA